MFLFFCFRQCIARQPESSTQLFSSTDFLAFQAAVYVPNTDSLYFASKPAPGMDAILSRLGVQSRVAEHGIGSDIPNPACSALTSHGTVLFGALGNSAKPSGIYEFDLTTQRVWPVVTAWNDISFNGPSHMVIDGDYIWFTDPHRGSSAGLGSWVWRGRIYSDKGATVIRELRPIIGGLESPQGIAVSLDRRFLFLADSMTVAGDGSIDKNRPGVVYIFNLDNTDKLPYNRRIFARITGGSPNTLKVAFDGALHVGTLNGVQVFNSYSAMLIQTVEMTGGVTDFELFKGRLIQLNGYTITEMRRS
jgi:hypothetical protein